VSNTWESLTAALAGVPKLPDAACRGMHRLFDPGERDEPAEVVAERHEAALHICASCACFADCRSWLESLPARRRPSGVVAGLVVRIGGRPAA
jgi:hypothetical protein